jgi:hypothetical protein
MKKIVFILFLLAGSSGCMEHQLRDKTVTFSTTTTDLFFMQVLDNVARTIEAPDEMPYFNMPAAGTAQIQRSLSLTVTPQWALITAANSFGIGHTLFNQTQAAFTPQQIDQESWQVAPMPDPDRLMLMHSAYLRVTGHQTNYSEYLLYEYYRARKAWVDVTIKQTDYSKDTWDAWIQMVKRATTVRGLLPATADELPTTKGITFIESFPLTADEKNEYKKGKQPSQLAIALAHDKDYQEKKALYEVYIPPTPVSSPTIIVQKDDGAKAPGGSSGGGGGGGGSGPPGGGGGGGGKPPLPIDIPYDTFIQQGWYTYGRKCDVPKDACFVGHHGKTYVWVRKDQMDGLNRFTLAILDFYNIGNSGGSNIPQPPPATLGR